MKQCSKISIIVHAYNAEKTIRQCMESLLNQSYPKYEVIAVDHNSSDKTASILKSYKKIKCLNEEKKGPAAARNKGVRYSKGEILVFTDSDCIVEKDWLDKLTAPIRKGEYEVTMGGTVSATYGKLAQIEQKA